MDKQNNTVPLNVHTYCLKGKNNIPQWSSKLNTAPATAEIWHFEKLHAKVSPAFIT